MESPCADITAYRQGNGLASRKKVLPIVRDLLKAWEGPAGVCRAWGERLAEEACRDEEGCLPPTPMNSLVEGCPLDAGLPKLTPEAILEKFNKMATEGPLSDSTSPDCV
ncbi:hypothetical protein scyTo_0024924 [Scyliorhinus torazame]|uniref:Uncharacterized protein n=1 Tax=Scyliorhinus torazame TaxID=75743 RepID=A0A401QG62_SCYTO|nr:hypothetical protein [Scyliorhinus torazame]